MLQVSQRRQSVAKDRRSSDLFLFFSSLLGGEVGTKKQEQFKKSRQPLVRGRQREGTKKGEGLDPATASDASV